MERIDAIKGIALSVMFSIVIVMSIVAICQHEKQHRMEMWYTYTVGKYCGGKAMSMIIFDPINNTKNVNYYADSVFYTLDSNLYNKLIEKK